MTSAESIDLTEIYLNMIKNDKYDIIPDVAVIEARDNPFEVGSAFDKSPLIFFNFKTLTGVNPHTKQTKKALQLTNKITLSQNKSPIFVLSMTFTYWKKDDTKFDHDEITDCLIETRLETQRITNIESSLRYNAIATFEKVIRQQIFNKVKEGLTRLS